MADLVLDGPRRLAAEDDVMFLENSVHDFTWAFNIWCRNIFYCGLVVIGGVTSIGLVISSSSSNCFVYFSFRIVVLH